MPQSPEDDASQTDRHPPTLTGEILARYLKGDFAAEQALFSRFNATLLARARRYPQIKSLPRTHTPDDVVQEVFQRALAAGLLRNFEDRGRGSLEALLVTILERTMVDISRRHAAQKRGGGRTPIELEPSAEHADVNDRLASDDTTPTSKARAGELVDLARKTLGPRELEVWELIQIHGLDANEAAKRLGVSASAVRGILFRAHSKLVRALGGEREA